MIHPDTELRFISPEVGFGVFATKPIPRGTVVWVLCRLDKVMSVAEVDALPPAYQPIIERYAYVDSHGDYVLCWDIGRNVNHSCDPTLMGVGHDFEMAVRDIQPGEEITCEYGGLNLSGRLKCYCGSPQCRGSVSGDDVLHHWQAWDARVADSLKYAPQVVQPILGYARNPNQFWAWVHGTEQLPSNREYHAGGTSIADDVSSRPWALRGRLAGGE
ncbi:MAG: SET domain-containing protein-lysine N-methyltransferase [Alphaproteobacteria bacterium]|nr:SET domain-containing protein-lysine N-methyltransferase [Alphaproteobacteria bacterium]